MIRREKAQSPGGREEEMDGEFFSEKARDEAIMKVKTEFGKTAADIGAGSGFMTEGLLNAGLNVVITDSSEENIKILRERFSHFKEVKITGTSADKFDIEDNSLDYVFTYMHLHNTEYPLSVIKEMHRILKPGGKLAVTDLVEHNNEFILKQFHHRWPGFNMPDLYEWFVKAGLKEISIEVLGQSCSCESDTGDLINTGIFLAYGEK